MIRKIHSPISSSVKFASIIRGGFRGSAAFLIFAALAANTLFSNSSMSFIRMKPALPGSETAVDQDAGLLLEMTRLQIPRRGHSATGLQDGRILIVGGENESGLVREMEFFDPASRVFSLGANMITARADHTAVLLADGRVLIVGGHDPFGRLDSTEIFDPLSNTFHRGPSLNRPRSGHTGAVLFGGRYLIVGGDEEGTAELFDPGTQSFILLNARLGSARSFHAAALLQSGKVLIAGGLGNDGGLLSSAYLFDPESMSFSQAANEMHAGRTNPMLRVLPDGKVQVIGGDDESSMEMFNPDQEHFTAYAHLPVDSQSLGGLLRSPARVALIHLRKTSHLNFQSVVSELNDEVSAIVAGVTDRIQYSVSALPGSRQVMLAGGTTSSGAATGSVVLLAASDGASITTDKTDYSPGQTVVITGAGWKPGEVVDFLLRVEPKTSPDTALTPSVADENGNFVNKSFIVRDSDADVTLFLTATGRESGLVAQTTFTDVIVPTGTLKVTKTIDWQGTTPTSQYFEICVQGLTPSCKTIQDPGGTLTWSVTMAGQYTVTETSPGNSWTVTGSPATVAVGIGQITTVLITNTLIAGVPLTALSTPAAATTCEGNTQTFTAAATGGTAPYTYTWDGPGGFNAAGLSIIVTVPGNYTVTVTDAAGHTATSTATLTVNSKPVVTVDVPSAAICEGNIQTFAARVAGGTGPYGYAWAGPNGFSATTESVSVSVAGTYVVSVTDSKNCTAATAQALLAVNPKPRVTIDFPLATICEGNTQIFTATASGGTGTYSYNWTGPAGFNATSPSITVSTAGIYTVSVIDSKSCNSVTAQSSLTVNPKPVATITANGQTEFCEGGSVTLTAIPDGATYLWSTGATSQSITVSNSGSYSVTITNASGCSATSAPAVVTVNQLPTATITASGPTTFCQGGFVTLTASPAGATYLWSNGATTQFISVSNSGSYSVTVKNASGCSAPSAPTVVTVNPLPTATITASGPTTFCEGGSVTLTASPAGATYLWSMGATSQSITVNSSGSYSVAVTNTGGCSATSAPAVVTVSPLPTATITAGGPTTFCQGGSVTLTASPAGATYLWSTGATSQSITVINSGTYSLTVTSAGGCSATSASTVVTVNPLPTATITASGPTTFCEGGSVTLTTSPAGATYLWSTGATSQSIIVSNSGSYSVTITNASNCSATSTPTVVTVNACPVSLACAVGTGQTGANYTSLLVASGGVPPYSFSIASGSLPSGLVLNSSTGAITGIPTTGGAFSYTAKAIDSRGSATSTTTSNCAITIAAPSLGLIKSASPATYTIAGQQISYSYVLQNSGNVPLDGPLTVNDDKIVNPNTVTCPVVPSGFAPGASVTCSALYSITQADMEAGSVTNHATAAAKYSGAPVASNPAQATVAVAAAPKLSLSKGANPTTYSATSQTIIYNYVLTNTGSSTLSAPFTVSDDKVAVTCPATPTSLAPGASITCTSSYVIRTSDIGNVNSLPNGVRATVYTGGWLQGQISTQDTSISGAGPGVPDGIYAGWCIQDHVAGDLHNQPGTLYSSIGSSLPADIAGLPWNKINYVVNHKIRGAGKTDRDFFEDVQTAIWLLLGEPNPDFGISAEAQQMVADANAHPGFAPGIGDVVAVIIYSDGMGTVPTSTQESILEMKVLQSITNHAIAAGKSGSATVVSNQAQATVNQVLATATAPTPPIDSMASGDQPSPSTSITSMPFSTTAGNELLLAFISADNASGTNTKVSGVTGAGLIWQLVTRTNVQRGTAEIWRALSPAILSNMTVTATLSQAVASSITVVSLAGVDTSGTNGSGAIGATGSANGSSGAPSITLTTTRNNSWVFGVGTDWDNPIARSMGTNQSLIHQYMPPVGDTYWVQRINGSIPLSGTEVTLNDVAPTTDRWNLAAVEILPAGPPPQLVSVPSVLNLTQAAATAAINGVSLTVGMVSTAPSSTAAAGLVISQNPAAGTQVQAASAVAFVVSSGPAPASPTADKTVYADASGKATTSKFSTSGANEVLIAFAASDGPTSGGQTLTVTGAGLTWTLVQRANTQLGTSEIWKATATSQLSNVTVSSTQKFGGYHQSLTVVAFAGATGTGASAAAGAASGAPSVSLTTTRANSVVYGVGNDWDKATARVLGADQALIHQWIDTAIGDTFWVQAIAAAIPNAGSIVRLTDTAPGGDQWNYAIVEIIP